MEFLSRFCIIHAFGAALGFGFWCVFFCSPSPFKKKPLVARWGSVLDVFSPGICYGRLRAHIGIFRFYLNIVCFPWLRFFVSLCFCLVFLGVV